MNIPIFVPEWVVTVEVAQPYHSCVVGCSRTVVKLTEVLVQAAEVPRVFSVVINILNVDGSTVTVYLYCCDVQGVDWELSPCIGGYQSFADKDERAGGFWVVMVSGQVYGVPVSGGSSVT